MVLLYFDEPTLDRFIPQERVEPSRGAGRLTLPRPKYKGTTTLSFYNHNHCCTSNQFTDITTGIAFAGVSLRFAANSPTEDGGVV